MAQRDTLMAVGIICSALALAAMLAVLPRNERQIAYFASALQENRISVPLLLADGAYSFDGGRLRDDSGHSPAPGTEREGLSLAYAYAATLNSPIASFEGSDPETVERYAAQLRMVSQAAASSYADKEKALLLEGLYPVRFLEALPEAEHLRMAFLASPAHPAYDLYAQAVDKMLRAYIEDLRAYHDAFEHFVPRQAPPYATLSGVMTRESVLSVIDTLERMALAQRSKLAARTACIQGALRKCIKEEVKPAVPGGSRQPLGAAPYPVKAIATAFREATHTTQDIPYVALAQSACAPAAEGPSYFLPTNTGLVVEDNSTFGEFLNDMYFFRTSAYAHVPGADTMAYFRSKGIEFVRSNPMLFYSCPHLGKDASLLGTVPAVFHIFSSSTPSVRYEADARALVAQAARSQDPLALRFATRFAYGTAGFDKIVRQVSETMRIYAELEHKGVPLDSSTAWLLFGKSGFPTLFAIDNRTLIPEDVQVTDDALSVPISPLGAFVRWSELSPSEQMRALKDLPSILEFHQDGLLGF